MIHEAGMVKSVRVMVVDDHPLVREGIRRLLELEQRIEIAAEAGSAEESFHGLDLQAVDVVLMDIRLPGMDGIEATRQFKAIHPLVKIVVLSSFGIEYLSQAIEAGADGYILKTATQSELVEAVFQAAQGEAPIDHNLTSGLLNRFASLSKVARSHGITGRQMEVLRLLSVGTPSKEIAFQLSISLATLKRDIRGIFNHLGVNDRAAAIAEAYNRKLL